MKLPLWRAMRPEQWTKNAVVAAAYMFAVSDRHQAIDPVWGAIRVAGAVLAFCLVSSAVYLLNDIRDREADSQHPVKRYRPIAAGLLRPVTAASTAGLLATASLACGYALQPGFAATLALYLGMQAIYTLALKQIALVDVFIIAAGFVIRAIAGAVVLQAVISPWLLLCTFLLALLLALCKRRHEISLHTRDNASRKALDSYSRELTDQLIAITSGATTVTYAIYTLSPSTVEKFGTSGLGFTIPFVMFGIFRYLDLVYRHDEGERPERLLLHDKPLRICVLLYGLTAITVLALACSSINCRS